MGVMLASYAEPIQDISSRELFLRALTNKVLAEDSTRKAFPELPGWEVVQAAPPMETEPAQSVTETAEPPPPPAPVEAVSPEDEPNLFLPQNEGLETPALPPDPAHDIIRPTDDAVEFLKKMFPNIFF
jgi:hypothetical protein